MHSLTVGVVVQRVLKQPPQPRLLSQFKSIHVQFIPNDTGSIDLSLEGLEPVWYFVGGHDNCTNHTVPPY